jgi:hypothetical protein
VVSTTSINPYEPTLLQGDDQTPRPIDDTLIVPFRLDWLTLAAFVASLMDAVAIWIFFSNGTGMIGDRILAPLASKSPVWIPIYRLAVPMLIPVMPQTCRQSFAVFYLATGVAFSINNFSGHFLGKFVFLDSIGLLPTGAACFVFAIVAFYLGVMHSRNVTRSLRNTMAWTAFAALIQFAFYLVDHVI